MDPLANRFLEGFSENGRKQLIGCLIRESFTGNDYLFQEGDTANDIYLVIEGQVEIVKAAGNRVEVLNCYQAGDFFGEIGVLDGFGRSTGARAKGSVVIGKIPSGPLLEVLSTEPITLTLSLFKNVLAYMRRTNELFVREVVHKEKLSLVGEMASSLMHDLRNPVAGIRMAADLVGMNHTDEETNHCCDGIRLQCDRLVGMATELLEFSRGESKLHLNRTTPEAFIHQFHTLNDEYFRRTGLAFGLEAQGAEIEIDSMRLLRVLQNLVTNAVEAVGGKPDGRIDIKAWLEDSIFFLTVGDNGPGIPEEVQARLFEAFFTYGKKNGTGLGMAIVQNVVAAHGGTITFQTAPDQGTTFVVQLPQGVINHRVAGETAISLA